MILSAIACLLVSTVAVLTFVLLTNQTKTSLSLAVDQITVHIGDSVPVSYEINMPGASVSFTVANQNIANVIDDKIYGIQEGKTLLRAVATYESQTCYSSCELVVLSEEAIPPYLSEFDYKIDILSGGYARDSFIYVEDTVCLDISIAIKQGTFEYYDLNIVQHSSNLQVSKQFCHYIIKAEGNGNVLFALPNSNFQFTLHFILVSDVIEI